MARRKIKQQKHDPDWYLREPRTRKWMAQCAACGAIGYRHDAPEQFFGRSLLIKYFEPISPDDRGLCEECQALIES